MHIAQNWRLKGQRYGLKGIRCEICQSVHFPPRAVCPVCRERAAEAREQTAVAVKVSAEPARLSR